MITPLAASLGRVFIGTTTALITAAVVVYGYRIYAKVKYSTLSWSDGLMTAGIVSARGLDMLYATALC